MLEVVEDVLSEVVEGCFVSLVFSVLLEDVSFEDSLSEVVATFVLSVLGVKMVAFVPNEVSAFSVDSSGMQPENVASRRQRQSIRVNVFFMLISSFHTMFNVIKKVRRRSHAPKTLQ